MSSIIKELIAKFSSDTSGLESGTSKANAIIGTFAKTAAAAALTVGTAFAVLAVKQAHAGDELGKISDKFGVATEALSRYDHAAALADVSTGELANAFKFMQHSMVESIKGTEGAVLAYRALGLNAKELIKLKPEDSFARIATALSKIENPAQRSALAMDIFGRAGANMLPMLKDGAAGLKAAADEADRFGLTISRVDAASLEAANDAIKKIGDAASGAARQFSVGLAPAVSSVVERLLKGVDAADEFNKFGKNIGFVWVLAIQGISDRLEKFKLAWMELKILVMETGKAIRDLAHQDTTELGTRIIGMRAEYTAAKENLALTQSGKKSSYLVDYVTARQSYENQNVANKKAGSKPIAPATIPESFADAKKSLDDFNKAADDAIKKQQDLGNAVGDTANQIMDSFRQGGSVLQSFGKVALNVLNDVVNSMTRMSFGGTATGGLGGLIANSLKGSLFGPTTRGYTGQSAFASFGAINWHAQGDVISGRTVFPASNGMHGAGEAGEEGVLPLTRVNGKLGVHASGGKNVTQNITINAGVSQTVRAEIMRLLPQIKQEAVRAVAENSFRGITP